MAVATAPSLNRHFPRRISNLYSRVKQRRPWLPPGDATLFNSRRNWDSHLFVYASSSSSPSSSPPSPNSPTDDLTAELCVNTGLDLFKRGRVSTRVRFEWFCGRRWICFSRFWVFYVLLFLAAPVFYCDACMIMYNG